MGSKLRHLPVFAFGLLLPVVTGCSLDRTSPSAPERGMALQGTVYGGQNPLTGAHVYLLQQNTFTNGGPGITPSSGNQSQSLLTSSGSNVTLDLNGGATNGFYYVTSDSNGMWAITGDYSCTSGEQVYLYALGGSSGSGNNASSGLLAALGTCPTPSSGPATFSSTLTININELTTVAAAYGFAGYASDALHVSTSGTAGSRIGITNAFANADNLVGLTSGAVLATTQNGLGTVPQAEIITLADILASCVNSNGAVTGPTNPTACYTLFTNALSGGTTGTQPTDTATAAINIAHNPGVNVAALFALAAATPPFASGLTSAPNDFTIAVNYTAGGISKPMAIAIDGSGDAWIANNGSTASVTELSPLGAALNGSPLTGGGLTSPDSIALDNNGNAWITNDTNPGSLTELNGSSGAVVTGSPFTGGGLNEPYSIAIDGSDDLWVANYAEFATGSVSAFKNTLTPFTGSPFGSGFGADESVAVDTIGDVWAVDDYLTSADKFNGTTGAFEASYAEGMNNPTALAIDASNNVWIATHGSYVEELNSSGTVLSGTGYKNGGVHYSQDIAMDGASNAWIANSSLNINTAGLLSEFNNSGTAITPTTGYTSSTLVSSSPMALAIDGSGDVWVTNNGNASVSEFIGAAVPVVTPLAYGVEIGELGRRP